jgi:hypothetical protein
MIMLNLIKKIYNKKCSIENKFFITYILKTVLKII